jgi:tripartite-type tricarboxylate transporter receptor subunit TctC
MRHRNQGLPWPDPLSFLTKANNSRTSEDGSLRRNLNAAANRALQEPEVQSRLDEIGANAMTGTPGEFVAFIRQETDS